MGHHRVIQQMAAGDNKGQEQNDYRVSTHPFLPGIRMILFMIKASAHKMGRASKCLVAICYNHWADMHTGMQARSTQLPHESRKTTYVKP